MEGDQVTPPPNPSSTSQIWRQLGAATAADKALINELQTRNDDLQKELENVKADTKAQLNAKDQRVEEAIRIKNEDYPALQDQYAAREEELDSLKEQHAYLEQHLNHVEEQYKKQENELKQLQKQSKEKQKVFKELQRSHEAQVNFNTQLRRIQNDLEQSKTELAASMLQDYLREDSKHAAIQDDLMAPLGAEKVEEQEAHQEEGATQATLA